MQVHNWLFLLIVFNIFKIGFENSTNLKIVHLVM